MIETAELYYFAGHESLSCVLPKVQRFEDSDHLPVSRLPPYITVFGAFSSRKVLIVFLILHIRMTVLHQD